MGKCSFLGKPRLVTPQIEHLGKMSPVLRVPTPIYAVAKQIRWENINFFNKT